MSKIFDANTQRVDKLLSMSFGSNSLASMKPRWDRFMQKNEESDYKFQAIHGSRSVTEV